MELTNESWEKKIEKISKKFSENHKSFLNLCQMIKLNFRKKVSRWIRIARFFNYSWTYLFRVGRGVKFKPSVKSANDDLWLVGQT